jgi:gliding motility-associated lipoprotein GldD
MKRWISVACIVMSALVISCTQHYTPKPRGYFRIEPPVAVYDSFPYSSFPYAFNVSNEARIQVMSEDSFSSLEIHYDTLGAVVYCSFLKFKASDFKKADAESRQLVERDAKSLQDIKEQEFDHPEEHVFGSLFLIGGESASPVQFQLTDSVSRMFRGSLYFDCRPNPDSLAPVIDYVSKDIRELMQSFKWN